MTKKELKIFIGEIVLLSTYSDSAKKQLLNFIRESDIDQLKNIALDAIDNISENELFGSNLISFAQHNPVSTYYLVTSIIEVGHKLYKNVFSQSARACMHQPNKEECIKKYKIKALDAQVKKLQSDSHLCNNTTDPNKCLYSINKKINKLKYKLRKLK